MVYTDLSSSREGQALRRLPYILGLALAVMSIGCPWARQDEGIVRDLIDPALEVSHPLYYWETENGKTSIHRIMRSTSDINTLLWGLDRVRDVRSSRNAVYILQDDNRDHLMISRLEKDSRMVTEARPGVDLTASERKPWTVSGNDVVAVTGVDTEGMHRLILVTFGRKEPEEFTRAGQSGRPTITHEEREWFHSADEIGPVRLAAGGDRVALILPLDAGSGERGLYFLDEPGASPVRVGEDPVVEMGGFSLEGLKFLATFSLEDRVDLFLIDTQSLELTRITRVPLGYRTGSPAWHPEGRYFLYTTDFTQDITIGSTPLSGEQLFLYSLTSRDTRRLTAYEDMTIRVDFAPNGDFLLYTSSRTFLGGLNRGLPPRRASGSAEKESGNLETWWAYYVAWDPDQFNLTRKGILGPGDLRLLISWTVGEEGEIGFAWGPDPQF